MSATRSRRSMVLIAGLGAFCLLVTATAEAGHVRPKSARKVAFPLVPAFAPCVTTNRTHGPPLAFPSCHPPEHQSHRATVGGPDAYGGAANFSGSVALTSAVSVPGPPNEADIYIDAALTDVRCWPTGGRCGGANAAGPADYSGETQFAMTFRITDHWNSPTPGGGPDPATMVDHTLVSPNGFACAETASTSIGSTCDMSSSWNAMIPGSVNEKRGVWDLLSLRIDDGGADGLGETDSDNTIFARPGVFIP